jgi:D-sedoheptulose 7-phosphate isomerase
MDIKKILSSYNNLILSDNSEQKLVDLKSLILEKSKDNKLFVFGNGGSAAIADHFAVDMTKNALTKTLSMNNSSMITCLSNDYGYSEWMKKCLEFYAKENDIVFLISSSGNSENVINAAQYCKLNNMKVITFTGFDENNSLKACGDINFWVDSKSYNIVENVHQIWILTLVDLIIGKIVYPAS